jgi:hypothetical protein
MNDETCRPRFSNRTRAEEGFLNRFALSREAPAQTRQVMHTQAPRDIPQALPIHRQESAGGRMKG